MHNHRKFVLPVITGLIFVMLGLGCWYIGPSQHALNFGTAQDTQVESHDALGMCEKCHQPLRTVHGKFGDFVGCSGYPACRYIKRPKASFNCPQCHASIEKRVWSGGILWGCSNYPDCRYAIFSDIEDTPCVKCHKSVYLLKKIDTQGLVTLECPNRQCAKSSSESM